MICKIEEFPEVNGEEWDDFFERRNPAQLYKFGKICQGTSSRPIYVSIYCNDCKVFQWLMFISKKFFLSRLYTLSEPWPVEGKYIELALNEVRKMYNPFRFDFYSIALSKFQEREILNRLGFDEVFEYSSNVVDLLQEENELFSGIHSKHRNVIRKAVKNGLLFRELSVNTENLKRYYDVSVETYKRSSGKNVPFVEFQNYANTGLLRLFVVESENSIEAASSMLVSQDMAIYWHGASVNHTAAGASNLLHWETMKKLKREGVQFYDFGGIAKEGSQNQKIEGINRFKMRFGGDLRIFYGGIKIFNCAINIMFTLFNKLRM